MTAIMGSTAQKLGWKIREANLFLTALAVEECQKRDPEGGTIDEIWKAMVQLAEEFSKSNEEFLLLGNSALEWDIRRLEGGFIIQATNRDKAVFDNEVKYVLTEYGREWLEQKKREYEREYEWRD